MGRGPQAPLTGESFPSTVLAGSSTVVPTTTEGDTMSRTIIARGAALAAATMLALTACGGTDETTETPDAPAAGVEEQEDADTGAEEDAEAGAEEDTEADDSAAEEDASEEDAEGSEGGDAAAGEGAVVEIGTEFTDEETGDVITIVS